MYQRDYFNVPVLNNFTGFPKSMHTIYMYSTEYLIVLCMKHAYIRRLCVGTTKYVVPKDKLHI